MTYKTLLKKLQKLTDEQLNQDLLFILDYQKHIAKDKYGIVKNRISFKVASSDIYTMDDPEWGLSLIEDKYQTQKDEDFEKKIYEKGKPYFKISNIPNYNPLLDDDE